jgi:hypothetical protein
MRAAQKAGVEAGVEVRAEGGLDRGTTEGEAVGLEVDIVGILRIEGATALETDIEAGPAGRHGLNVHHHRRGSHRLLIDDVGRVASDSAAEAVRTDVMLQRMEKSLLVDLSPYA